MVFSIHLDDRMYLGCFRNDYDGLDHLKISENRPSLAKADQEPHNLVGSLESANSEQTAMIAVR